MAVKRCVSDIDVVKAAEIRIKNVFNNNMPVYMSFSGGKDSLCLAQLVVNLIQQGQINPAQLTVQFIDEEAIFPCIEKTVLAWRQKFLLMGAKFEWYCIEVKHFNCFNALENDESFICWDRTKQDVWVRQPQLFAIRTHKKLRPRIDTYQEFMPRVCSDGIAITGIRTAESIQRLKNIALMNYAGNNITNKKQIFPIYDWTNHDVWLYLKEQHVEIPDIYLYLWQSCTGKNGLRVSQFFSVDTAKSLVKMNEYYPDLMERVIRREPNAYLATLYWDSEMFGRKSRARRELEGEIEKDYKAELLKVFDKFDTLFDTKHKRHVASYYRKLFLQTHTIATQKEFREMYEGLMSGDPKLRTFRAVHQRIYSRYVSDAKAKEAKKAGEKHGREQ